MDGVVVAVMIQIRGLIMGGAFMDVMKTKLEGGWEVKKERNSGRKEWKDEVNTGILLGTWF